MLEAELFSLKYLHRTLQCLQVCCLEIFAVTLFKKAEAQQYKIICLLPSSCLKISSFCPEQDFNPHPFFVLIFLVNGCFICVVFKQKVTNKSEYSFTYCESNTFPLCFVQCSLIFSAFKLVCCQNLFWQHRKVNQYLYNIPLIFFALFRQEIVCYGTQCSTPR